MSIPQAFRVLGLTQISILLLCITCLKCHMFQDAWQEMTPSSASSNISNVHAPTSKPAIGTRWGHVAVYYYCDTSSLSTDKYFGLSKLPQLELHTTEKILEKQEYRFGADWITNFRWCREAGSAGMCRHGCVPQSELSAKCFQ